MKNYIGCADRLTITAPEDLTSGKLYVVNAMAFIPIAAALDGEKAAVHTRGEFSYAKATGFAPTLGDRAYYDPAADNLVGTASTSVYEVGYFTAAAASGDTTCTFALRVDASLNSSGAEAPAPS